MEIQQRRPERLEKHVKSEFLRMKMNGKKK